MNIDYRIPVLKLSAAALLLATFAAAATAAAPPATAADQAAAAALPIAEPEGVGMSSDRLQRLSDAMAGYIDQQLVAGAVTLVARRGRVVHFEAQGHRWQEEGEPMTRDTIFRIASMTKPIASVALMTLYEEGRFQLRDPISKYLPKFAEMKVATVPDADEYLGEAYKLVEAKRPITVQHILTHTAGFANSYRGLVKAEYAKLRTNRDPEWTVGDMVDALAELPLEFHPGDAWQYGPSVEVVGRLVEVLSGQTFDEYLKERVFEPLGMTDTTFYLPESKVDRFAALYRPGEDGTIELAEAPDLNARQVREPHKYFSGSGGLVSTAADYYRFHQMMLSGGELDGQRILGRKTIELMTANHTGDHGIWLRGPGFGFGLGYSVVTDAGPSAMPASVGAYSWGGAYCTVFWVDPQEELIGILMTQVRPYTHLNIRQDLQTLTYQAIVD